MEEILKQILSEIKELKANQAKTDQKIEALGDRINTHEKNNKDEFRQLNKKLDGITEVVAKTMEDVTELKSKVERQDIELKVLKGAR
jgi:predicted  nucleic acid-binding Zn-ribbon protein